LAVLQGLLLPSALLAAATHPHAKKTHEIVKAAKPHRAKVNATTRHKGAPSSSHAARNSAYSGGALTLRRVRSESTHLQTTQPVVTALIDPVPQGHISPPAPMKGSHDSLVRQNVRSEEEGLTRIRDDAALLSMRRDGELVALPATSALTVDVRLPGNRRYCRTWTAQFLSDLSRVHYGRFHRALQVNSAVRTVDYQRHLELVNGNAAPAEGDDASPHLTGATIDIAKKGLSMEEIGWMRAYLMPLQAAGKIDVEEEFYQACFHITVYRSYHPSLQALPIKVKTDRLSGDNAALLAARVR
jgi:hypothetical protein